MTDREFFIENIVAELPRFEAVWKALPVDQMSWRPHERSQSAIEILTNLAVEASMYPTFLQEGLVAFENIAEPQTISPEQLWSIFRKGLEAGKELASGMTDEDWKSSAKLIAGGQTAWETTRGWMAWGFLLDMIHHRGQLSVYIRPMGGKVPSIYGQSGDGNQ